MINNKIVIAARKPGHSYSAKRQQNQHTNISKLLDKLLENYVNLIEWYEQGHESQFFVCPLKIIMDSLVLSGR